MESKQYKGFFAWVRSNSPKTKQAKDIGWTISKRLNRPPDGEISYDTARSYIDVYSGDSAFTDSVLPRAWEEYKKNMSK